MEAYPYITADALRTLRGFYVCLQYQYGSVLSDLIVDISEEPDTGHIKHDYSHAEIFDNGTITSQNWTLTQYPVENLITPGNIRLKLWRNTLWKTVDEARMRQDISQRLAQPWWGRDRLYNLPKLFADAMGWKSFGGYGNICSQAVAEIIGEPTDIARRETPSSLDVELTILSNWEAVCYDPKVKV